MANRFIRKCSALIITRKRAIKILADQMAINKKTKITSASEDVFLKRKYFCYNNYRTLCGSSTRFICSNYITRF